MEAKNYFGVRYKENQKPNEIIVVRYLKSYTLIQPINRFHKDGVFTKWFKTEHERDVFVKFMRG